MRDNRIEILEKKEILDKIFGDMKMGRQMTNFKVCALNKDDDGKVTSTKWMTYLDVCDIFSTEEEWKIRALNQRTVLKNEVVLDMESMEGLDDIITRLKEMALFFRVYSTRSRGVHIHIFFNTEITNEERMCFIKVFGGDEQMTEGHMISLECVTHYKSGKKVEGVDYYA